MGVALLGICFWREAPGAAVGPDRRAGKWGLMRAVARADSEPGRSLEEAVCTHAIASTRFSPNVKTIWLTPILSPNALAENGTLRSGVGLAGTAHGVGGPWVEAFGEYLQPTRGRTCRKKLA